MLIAPYLDYLMKNDNGKSFMNKIDLDLQTNPDTPTFFAGHYWKLKNGKWYKLLTNVDNVKVAHVGMVLLSLGCKDIVKFHKEAVDFMGNPLPGCFSIWIPVEGISKETINLYFKKCYELTARYKELLIQCGIPKEELVDITQIYLGCEKDRWPDKPWITEKILELIEDAKK